MVCYTGKGDVHMDEIQSASVDPAIIALCQSRLTHDPVEDFLLGVLI